MYVCAHLINSNCVAKYKLLLTKKHSVKRRWSRVWVSFFSLLYFFTFFHHLLLLFRVYSSLLTCCVRVFSIYCKMIKTESHCTNHFTVFTVEVLKCLCAHDCKQTNNLPNNRSISACMRE